MTAQVLITGLVVVLISILGAMLMALSALLADKNPLASKILYWLARILGGVKLPQVTQNNEKPKS